MSKVGWQLFCRLNVTVYPVEGIETDQVPLWMPTSSVPRENLFRALTEMASEGAKVRARFDGASLYDRLRHEPGIIISDPSRWGSSKYREAIASLSTIEVPGTGFQRAADSGYLWPRCFRFDRDRQADFDDDMPGWRDLTASTAISLRDFPSVDLNAVVVVAGPGFGKTTLVNAIARKATLSGLLPAIVPITKLSEADLSISDYLSQIVNSEFDVQIDWRAAAAGGSLVLLLDGLDEVSSDRRSIILERLRVYRASNPAVRWLLTVRDAAALAIPDGAIPVELAQLQDEDILAYVNFYRPNEPGLADALVNRIASQPDLAHLVRIPIFLALLLVMRQENEDLNRSDLLDTYLATLFNPAAFTGVPFPARYWPNSHLVDSPQCNSLSWRNQPQAPVPWTFGCHCFAADRETTSRKCPPSKQQNTFSCALGCFSSGQLPRDIGTRQSPEPAFSEDCVD